MYTRHAQQATPAAATKKWASGTILCAALLEELPPGLKGGGETLLRGACRRPGGGARGWEAGIAFVCVGEGGRGGGGKGMERAGHERVCEHMCAVLRAVCTYMCPQAGLCCTVLRDCGSACNYRTCSALPGLMLHVWSCVWMRPWELRLYTVWPAAPGRGGGATKLSGAHHTHTDTIHPLVHQWPWACQVKAVA